MQMNFSDTVQGVIQSAGKLAMSFGYEWIAPEHILLAVIDESLKNENGDNIVIKALKHLNVDLFSLIEDLENSFDRPVSPVSMDKIPFDKRSETLLKISFLEARHFHSETIDAMHILLAYFRLDNGSMHQKLYAKYNLGHEQLKEAAIEFS